MDISEIFLKSKEIESDVLVTLDSDGQHDVDEIKKLIFSKQELLKDLNLEITLKMLELIGEEKKIQLSSKKEVPENIRSLLGYFKPSKMPHEHLQMQPYIQVFNYKYGFIPNLSILDLLFNEGPYALSYLLNASSK